MLDSDGGTEQLESIDDISSFQAGTVTSTGLAASSGVLTLDIANLTATATVNDADLVVIDDGAGGTLRKMTRANFIESAALDSINIDGGAIDGTPIGANSASTGRFSTLTATGNASVSGSLHVVGDLDVVGNINSVTKTASILEVEDLNIICASGSNASNADGGGLLVGGYAKSNSVAGFTWDNDTSNIEFSIAGSNEALMSATVFAPATSDGMALGSTALMWSDAFLASGAVVNFNNGDVTLTHAANKLSVAGGNLQVPRLEIDSANDYIDVDTDLKLVAAADIVLDPAGGDVKADGNLLPNSADGGTLGSAAAEWSDLFLADGGVANFGNDQDVTLTHVADTGLLLNSSRQLQFGDSGTYIHQASDGILKAVSDDNIVLQSGASFGDYVRLSALTCSFGVSTNPSPAMLFSGSHANTGLMKWVAQADKFYFQDDILVMNDERIFFQDTDTYIYSSTDGKLDLVADSDFEITAPAVVIDASTDIDLQTDQLKLGQGGDTDIVMTWNANSNDGVLTWMEDEDYFKFSDDVLMNSDEKLLFRDSGLYINSSANGQLDIDADVELEITAPTLDIDASTAVAITSPSVVIDSSTSDKPVVTIKNSNADANPATLEFTKESASPADDDELGEVVFNGDDDGGSETMFAKIVGVSTDVSNGSEDGALQFKFRAAGAVKTVELGAGAGLTLPNDSTYGVVKAHSMVTYSDETLKTNIQPLESALETVNKLQGVSYEWKSDGSNDLGFIAQDVNKVVPQIVYGTGDGDLGLDYSKLTSILVEAVKEQQAQINDLKSKLDK